jgi:hypothetical protein
VGVRAALAAPGGAIARTQSGNRDRIRKLGGAEATYRQQCRQREADAEARNQELSTFITNLAFDVGDCSGWSALIVRHVDP